VECGRIAAGLARLLLAAHLAHAQAERHWMPLAKDALHDPSNAALRELQEPAQALRALAPDTAGNQVRWMEALTKGQIRPRAGVDPQPAGELRETEIFLNLRGGAPIVRFPHRQHTLWLGCANCHDGIFKKEVDGTGIDMRRILMGEQCGVCHGAVAFPLTECNRCHNTSRVGFCPPAGARGHGAVIVGTPCSAPTAAR